MDGGRSLRYLEDMHRIHCKTWWTAGEGDGVVDTLAVRFGASPGFWDVKGFGAYIARR